MGWIFFHGELISPGFFGCTLGRGCGWSWYFGGNCGKGICKTACLAWTSAWVQAAAGPPGPTSAISLRPVEAISGTSVRAGPPAQGCKMSSAMAIIMLSPNGWAADTGVGETTMGAWGLSGCCWLGIGMKWWTIGWGKGDAGQVSCTLSLGLLVLHTACI